MFKSIIIVIYMIIWTNKILGNVILLDSVSGIVQRENFTHWSLGFTGHIVLSLHSINGDADLYITENNKKASYEPDQYDLHSVSCGLDIVEIPRNFKRPIGIGIYGHPSHANSSYVLDVYYDVEKSQIKTDQFGDYSPDNTVSLEEEQTKEAFTGVRKFKIKAKLLAGIWSLLEIFDIVLFTF